MKIKEVMVEGLWGNFKANRQQAAGRKQAQQIASEVAREWNQYYGQSRDTNIARWASQHFNNSDVSQFPVPAVNNSSAVIEYFADLVAAYQAGRLSKAGRAPAPEAPAQNTPPEAQPIQPVQPAATIGALGKRATKQPAQPQAYQSPLNITIRQSTDPIIVDYNGAPYMLNNRGEWAKDGKDTAGSQASGPVQAEIDKVLQANNLL